MKLNTIPILSPQHWSEYELIDSGNFEKLERFGPLILQRPEPQAVWKPQLSESEWGQMRSAHFIAQGSHKGIWEKQGKLPEQWELNYAHKGLQLRFKLALTAFKHVGLFPEQAANWDYIYQEVKQRSTPHPRVLNLFAYTGGASLAACAAGADVVHVDSVKQVVSWARENMDRSGLRDIRWTVEDAVKFAEREQRRGNKYQGIILDPPAYGIGASGERWKLEEQIDHLLRVLSGILDPQDHFFLINTYSLGFSALIIQNLLKSVFGPKVQAETGELCLHSRTGQFLPLGVYGRFSKVAML